MTCITAWYSNSGYTWTQQLLNKMQKKLGIFSQIYTNLDIYILLYKNLQVCHFHFIWKF